MSGSWRTLAASDIGDVVAGPAASPDPMTTMESSAGPPAAVTPAPEKASVWEDFLDIFYAPGAVFARRENGSFWIPLLVVTLLVGILYVVNSSVWDPIMNAEMDRGLARAMEKNPQMTQEMATQMRGFGSMIGRVGAFIATPFMIFFVALFLWLAGKVVGARQSWHAALVVAAYAHVPRILEGVIVGIQGLFVDPARLTGRYSVSLGLARFLDPATTSPVMYNVVGRIDLFTIWVTVLLAIGLAVTGRVDRVRAAIGGLLVWLLGAIYPLIGALQM